MRAISIRQPYVWAILYAGKNVENRSRASHYRGPVLLHASATLGVEEHEDAVWSIESMRRDGPTGHPKVPKRPTPRRLGDPLPDTDIASLPLGGLCGIAVVTGCTVNLSTSHRGWHLSGAHGLKLERARALPFIPLAGSRVVPFDCSKALEDMGDAALITLSQAEVNDRIAAYRAAWRELGGA